MSTFETIKSLVYTIGPFLLPYLYQSYKKYQQYSAAHKASRRPVPRRIGIILNILFITTIIALVGTYTAFRYENLITKTGSRLQTPQNVLWERVASQRPARQLTSLDEKLRGRLASTDGRCLYLMYGPETMGNCPFCSSDEAITFFYYALPSILIPHLFNLIILGLATSMNIAGKEGNRFRVPVVLLACGFAVIEMLVWLNFDWKMNIKVTKAQDLFHFYGWARLARNAGLALIDASFAWFLWATSTNRIMVIQPPAKERIDAVIQRLEANSGKITAAGVIRNAIVRDEDLHQAELEHWKQEDEKFQEALEDEKVKKAISKAQSKGRLDPLALQREAAKYADSMLPAAGVEVAYPEA